MWGHIGDIPTGQMNEHAHDFQHCPFLTAASNPSLSSTRTSDGKNTTSHTKSQFQTQGHFSLFRGKWHAPVKLITEITFYISGECGF
mmetsp:Transcript_25373/g.34874  ORF Transcript_25373/g.34874 Transcript_25373/m.34874 type:complete len:87 (-) Transcript_25373:889-1149(-)